MSGVGPFEKSFLPFDKLILDNRSHVSIYEQKSSGTSWKEALILDNKSAREQVL